MAAIDDTGFVFCDSPGCERCLPASTLTVLPANWITSALGDFCPLHSIHPTVRPKRKGNYVISYKKLHSNLLLVTFRLLSKQGLRPSQIMAKIIELQTGPSGEPPTPTEANWIKAITQTLAAELGEGEGDEPEPDADAEAEEVAGESEDADAGFGEPEAATSKPAAPKAVAKPAPKSMVRGAP